MPKKIEQREVQMYKAYNGQCGVYALFNGKKMALEDLVNDMVGYTRIGFIGEEQLEYLRAHSTATFINLGEGMSREDRMKRGYNSVGTLKELTAVAPRYRITIEEL